MKPKPKHLDTQYAEQFQDQSVVSAYRNRPEYDPALFPHLRSLLGGGSGRVLDVGCGLGHVARPLAPLVEWVDAVDFSEAMIAQGRRLSGGAAPNLNWICAPIETARLSGTYGLITAGQSVHWFAWDVVLPRFAELLVPGGFLAIINRNFSQMPWHDTLMRLIAVYSTNQDYRPYNIFTEFAERGLYRKVGERQFERITYRQTATQYVEAFHSRNGLSRDRMSPEKAQAFDDAVIALIREHHGDKPFATEVMTSVTWGFPLRPSPAGT